MNETQREETAMYFHASEKPFHVGDKVQVIDTRSDFNGQIGIVKKVTPPTARNCDDAVYEVAFHTHPLAHTETFRCEQLELV